MRNALLAMAACLLMLAGCSPKGAVRTIRATTDTEADLGRIKEIDGPVTVRLLVKNDYPDTLHPVDLYTPCRCTKVHFSQEPVAPGEDEVLEVTYNPAYRPGPMMEQISVYYLHSPVKVRSLVIKGEVIGYNHPIEEDRPYNFGEGLFMSHMVLGFGAMAPGETRDMFFRHGNGNKRKADVRFEVPQEWQPYLRLRQPGTMKADERDTLHVRFTLPQDKDTVSFFVQPFVNGKPTAEKLKIRAAKR